uniref:Transmembrane protein 144 n=1 Tax=Plectus sambesii TaxID=2011161 RepID=A0A914VVR5_9BILA
MALRASLLRAETWIKTDRGKKQLKNWLLLGTATAYPIGSLVANWPLAGILFPRRAGVTSDTIPANLEALIDSVRYSLRETTTHSNITAVPIINSIGMSLGILIWGTTNCLFGWASGRFGWFGMTAQVPNNVVLNYLGLVFVLIGGAMFSLIESRPTTRESAPAGDPIDGAEYERLTDERNDDEIVAATAPVAVGVADKRRHLFGVIASLCAGFFYGITFAPVIYIQDHADEYEGASKKGLPYVFAHYSGIFLTATAFFLIYGAFKQNRPVINRQTVVPAYISGTLWAVAQSAWFVANENLSQAVSFPIIAMVPGVIASLWGVLYFREIRGRRNLRILCAAIAVTLTGAVLVGLSK